MTAPTHMSLLRGFIWYWTRRPWCEAAEAATGCTVPAAPNRSKPCSLIKKIPAPLRDGIPVLEVDGRIAAVWGVGADPAFLPRPGQRCYTINLYTKEGEVQIL